jgi:SlyX protein
MPHPDDLALRVAELETRAEHQDKTIEDLSEMVSSQWQAIDALKQQILRQKDRLAEIEAAGPGTKPEDEPPPPHY